MNVPIHPDEHLLNEVLRLFSITDRAVDEVQETRLIPLDELLERTLLAAEERCNHGRIILGPESFSCRRSRQRRALHCELSHIVHAPFGTANRVRPDRRNRFDRLLLNEEVHHRKADRMPIRRSVEQYVKTLVANSLSVLYRPAARGGIVLNTLRFREKWRFGLSLF